MRQDGLTKSQAVAWLKENSGATFTRPAVAPAAPARMLKPRDAEALLQRVVNFYARTLRKDETGLGYLKRRNLSGATLEVFRVGLRQRHAAPGVAEVGQRDPKSENFGRVERKGAGTLSRLRHGADFRRGGKRVRHLRTARERRRAAASRTCPARIAACGMGRRLKSIKRCLSPRRFWTA